MVEVPRVPCEATACVRYLVAWWVVALDCVFVYVCVYVNADILFTALALWLVCIIERSKILDPATESFFNIFNIML